MKFILLKHLSIFVYIKCNYAAKNSRLNILDREQSKHVRGNVVGNWQDKKTHRQIASETRKEDSNETTDNVNKASGEPSGQMHSGR